MTSNYKEINYNNLPEVLSIEEEKELFLRVYAGDEDAKNILIERNIRLVVYIVNYQFSNLKIMKEDLIQTGIIGLQKAVNHYDITKGSTFATFARTCIVNEILMSLRSYRRKLKEEELDKVIYDNSNNSRDITLRDTIKSNDNIEEEYSLLEEYKIVNDIINSLSPEDKELVEMIFYKGLTETNIAEILGVSQSYVSKRIKNILFDVKGKLIKAGVDYSLSNNSKTEKKSKDKKIKKDKIIKEEKNKNDVITNDDYLKLLNLLRMPTYKKLSETYSNKELMVYIFRFGKIDGKEFTTLAISNFMDLPFEEVLGICNRLLDNEDSINLNR